MAVRKSAQKRKVIIVGSLLLLILIRFFPPAYVEEQAHVLPDYPREDLSGILEQDSFSAEDYRILYEQTGLGKAAIDSLMQRENGKKSIIKFQENLFKKVRFVCEPNSIISNEERLVNDRGEDLQGTQFADLQNGYILITKSSHSFCWRNGHAAIMVDADKGHTLESVVLGTNSCLQDVTKWLNYPNFAILKLKDSSPQLLAEIASFAKTYLNDIPYALTAGIFIEKYEQAAEISATQCAHLVWRAFKEYGFCLDANRIVTPKAILNSPLLEVVQVYGMDPKKLWP